MTRLCLSKENFSFDSKGHKFSNLSQHCVIGSIVLHQSEACLRAAERRSLRRKLQGGKLQKSGNRAQTLASCLEGVISWGEMTHLQLQKQGITCLRRQCHLFMSRLLQIDCAEQKSSRADAKHCCFAHIQAVFDVGEILRVWCCWFFYGD